MKVSELRLKVNDNTKCAISACTKEDHSLHITVSVYQHTAYVDLLEKIIPSALAKAAEENIEFRFLNLKICFKN